MTERSEQHQLTGAYALNALDEPERAQFEVYLAQTDELRTEVTEMSDTAVLLGLASRPVTPSPELKANLMAMLPLTAQLGPVAEGGLRAVPTLEEQHTIRGIAEAPSLGAEARAQSRWYRRPVASLLVAAAAVALVAGGLVIGQNMNTSGYELAQAKNLAELSAAPDLKKSASSVDGGGTATLIWSDALQQSAILVAGLPALSAEKVYQLWYLDGTGATPAGTFSAAASGMTWRVLEGSRNNAISVGLTVEPRGGSTTPTTPPIVVIDGV